MPTICNDCNRFLDEEDGEGYVRHLDEHNQVQEALFGEKWLRMPAIGDCRYIVRHGQLYEYNSKDGWWFSQDESMPLPAIRHHEWMPL